MFRAFTSWLFDGERDSQLQKKDEILKYNSPVTHQFILTCFMGVPKFNHYLNEELNTWDLYKIDKMEFLRFMKDCVIKLRLTSNRHYTWRKNKYINYSKLHNALFKRYPYLKRYEITSLCENIDKMPKDEKDKYYATFGVDTPKESKIRRRQKIKKKRGKKSNNKIEQNTEKEVLSLKNFLRNFQLSVK